MKTIPGILLALLLALNVEAQCTPGANYADSTFGAWPDTTTNFPSGYAGIPYTTDLNFKVPNDAGDIDPDFAGSTITSFTVDSVVGLPSGMSYSCDISNCFYTGGSNGCAQISGTSPNPGFYNITIHITANLLVFGFPVPVPYSFEGYHIQLNELVAGLTASGFQHAMLYPNPAKETLTVSKEGLSEIEIYTLAGKQLILKTSAQQKQEISLSGLESGAYLIRLIMATGSETYTFVKE